MAKSSDYPLGHLVQLPKVKYVPSWKQDVDSLNKTFAAARADVRKNVGKAKRIHVGRVVHGKLEIATQVVRVSNGQTRPLFVASNGA